MTIEEIQAAVEAAGDMRKDGDIHVRNRIAVGAYFVSVQASEYHYCQPRESGLPIRDYSAVEVAVFKGDDWVTSQDDRLKPFAADFEDGKSPVAGYLDWEKVEAIVNALESAS